MARPPLRIGHHGSISFRTLEPGKVRAMAHVRDADGRRRQVTATGKSRSAAQAALLDRLDDRSGFGEGLTGESRLREVAAAWFAEIERMVADGQRAPNTARVYRSALDQHVLPAVGELRVREATAPHLSAFVHTMREHHRSAATKTSRAVLSGIMGFAVQQGAASTNPMRDVGRVAGERRATARAMTALERDTWLARMEADDVAAHHDLPDLTRMMLATGVRIGEILAVSYAELDIDAKTVCIDWNLVRVKGQGLRRMSTKTAAGERTLRLPGWAVDVVIRRGEAAGWSGPLFPAPGRRGRVASGRLWRDPSNTSKSLREARDRAGFDWVTSHAFRKTVATEMDAAGMTAREIADQLGHAKPSMTQDVYMGRKAVGVMTSVALEDMFGDLGESVE